ncbi:MAG TPA: AI-2E family transporter [Dehalococcoidia bacterium]|nr:AI-2E family transporter [Dehalococcoidia bacterium]
MSDEGVPHSLRYAAALSWRVLVVLASIVVLAFVVAKLRIVILPIFVSLLLATQLTPLVDRIQARGAPRWVGALLSLLLGGAIVAGIVAAVVGTVVADFDELELDFEEGLAEVGEFFVDELDVPQGDVDSSIDDLLSTVRSNSGTILGGIFTGASLALEVAAGSVLAVVFLFFFLKDGRTMWAWLVRLAPRTRRDDAEAIGQRTWRILGAYFRGTTAVAAVDGVFIGIALLIIGVPFVLPLAVLTFFGGFMPIVGAVAAGLVAVLVALVAEGLTEAILVAAAVVIVQQLEGNVLAPVLVGRSLELHPMVIILAVTVGGLVWGIIGAALAVPLVAVLTGIVTYLVDPDSPDSPDSEGLETDDAGDSATDADPEAAGDATAGEAAAPAA